MTLNIEIDGRGFSVDVEAPISLAIPMEFGGSQPNVYGVSYASATPIQTDTFTGNVLRGGSCNVSELHLVPHCNGTHTECVGHITRNPVYVSDIVSPGLIPCSVVSLEAGTGSVIDADQVETVLENSDPAFLKALVIRTLPNRPVKKERHYSDNSAPYFSEDAARALAEAGVDHLVLDLPSIDPLIDEGRMVAHRAFWGLEPGAQDAADGAPGSMRTITELAFVPESAKDGRYMLDLQMPSLRTDAVPSRPVLYRVQA